MFHFRIQRIIGGKRMSEVMIREDLIDRCNDRSEVNEMAAKIQALQLTLQTTGPDGKIKMKSRNPGKHSLEFLLFL